MAGKFDKFKKNFVANLPFKVVAVLIAFVLWFVVLNTTDPVGIHPVRIQLQVLNVDSLTGAPANLFLENEVQLRSQWITVQVRGTSREVEAVRSTLTAYIDLSDVSILSAVTVHNRPTVPVNISGNFSENAVILSHNPPRVELRLDEFVSKDIELEFAEIGVVDSDYEAFWNEATIYPNVLRVSGPSERVNRIERLLVEVDMSGRTESVGLVGHIPLAVDASGVPVSAANVRIDSVTVNIPIYRRGSVQILTPAVQGSPMVGFGVAGVSVSVTNVPLAGNWGEISVMNPIVLPPVQLDDEIASFSLMHNIADFLPPGVFVVNPIHNQIAVNVDIEPIVDRSFTVAINNIVVIGVSNDFAFSSPQISFAVRGLESVIANISNIPVSVNLAGFDVGIHQINVVLNLPAGVIIVGSPPTIIVEIFGEDTTFPPDEPIDLPPDDDESIDNNENSDDEVGG